MVVRNHCFNEKQFIANGGQATQGSKWILQVIQQSIREDNVESPKIQDQIFFQVEQPRLKIGIVRLELADILLARIHAKNFTTLPDEELCQVAHSAANIDDSLAA